MKAQVSHETTIEPRDLMYHLGLEPALHGREAKVLPLDHRCLWNSVLRGKGGIWYPPPSSSQLFKFKFDVTLLPQLIYHLTK